MAGEQEKQEHTDFKIVFQGFVPGIQGPWHPGVSRFLHVVGTLSQCQCSFVCSKGMW